MSVKCLIYCSKAKPRLFKHLNNNIFYHSQSHFDFLSDFEKENILNGKIVASFDCEKVEPFNCCCVPYRKENNLGYELFIDNGVYKVEWKENINLRDEEKRYNNPENYKDDGVVFERKDRYINTMLKNDDLEKAKLSPQELLDYISLGKEGYAIHISNLEIFDEPKELSEYSKRLPNGDFQQLGKAPQNMMNVCKIKYLIEDYVLISIKPEWVAKILNGEKTIEVRKKVVNALKELSESE